tara:strand:- start:208 stop:798 length:591 start_codon:yes stop_codon:yes gene_type:complete
MSCNYLEGCLGSEVGFFEWAIFSFVFLLAVLGFSRDYDTRDNRLRLNFDNIFQNLILVTVLLTPVLSHLWHILYGEGSITQFTEGTTLLAIFDVGDYDGSLVDSPYFDTWEFTVALELFVLKALGGFILSTNALGVDAGGRNFGGFLYADAILSLLMFGFIIPLLGGGGLFLVFTVIGLIVSNIVFISVRGEVTVI